MTATDTYPDVSERIPSGVDQRICPRAEQIPYGGDQFSDPELVLINHVHGLLGNHIMGPPQVKIAIASRTLGELSAAIEDIRAEYLALDDKTRSLARSYAETIHLEVRDDIDAARFEGRGGDIVPTLLRHYDRVITPEEGVVEDLQRVYRAKQALRVAVREGVMHALQLQLDIDAARSMAPVGEQVSIEIGGEVWEGRLLSLGSKGDGTRYADLILDDGSKKRVDMDGPALFGIQIPESEREVFEPDPEAAAAAEEVPEAEVAQAGLLSRLRR